MNHWINLMALKSNNLQTSLTLSEVKTALGILYSIFKTWKFFLYFNYFSTLISSLGKKMSFSDEIAIPV